MKVIINVVDDVDSTINAVAHAAAEAGGWGNISVVLVGDAEVKSEVFERLSGVLGEGRLESLILQPGGYYFMGISELNSTTRSLYEYLQSNSVKNEIQISVQNLVDNFKKPDDSDYSVQGVVYLLGVLKNTGAISIKMRGFRGNPTVYLIQ